MRHEHKAFFEMFKHNHLYIILYKRRHGDISPIAVDIPVNAPKGSPGVLYYPVGGAVLLSVTHSQHGMVHSFSSVVTRSAVKHQHFMRDHDRFQW